jgi:hypothetical protein
MEGDTSFGRIGFNQAFTVSSDATAYEQIFFNTLNWLETNRNGMTFGVLFAAAIMLLFSLLEAWKPKSSFGQFRDGDVNRFSFRSLRELCRSNC